MNRKTNDIIYATKGLCYSNNQKERTVNSTLNKRRKNDKNQISQKNITGFEKRRTNENIYSFLELL